MSKPTNKPARLDLNAYWRMVGTDHAQDVAQKAGTTWGYFRSMACGQKRPSYDLAKKLILAAKSTTPGFAPDLELIMEGGKTRDAIGSKIPPSAEFLASSGAAA